MKNKEHSAKTENTEPVIDWNVWHKPVMDSILQINWELCAKVLNYQHSLVPENTWEELCDIDVRETVMGEIETAIKGLTKEKCESFFVSGAYSHVRVWAPSKDEPEPCVEIAVVIEQTLF